MKLASLKSKGLYYKVKTFTLITRIDLYLAQVHFNARFYFLYPTTILPWSYSLVCVFHHL